MTGIPGAVLTEASAIMQAGLAMTRWVVTLEDGVVLDLAACSRLQAMHRGSVFHGQPAVSAITRDEWYVVEAAKFQAEMDQLGFYIAGYVG